MTFRHQYEPPCKFGVTKEHADAKDDVAKVKVEGLPTNVDLLALKLQVSWQLFIDDTIELPRVAI